MTPVSPQKRHWLDKLNAGLHWLAAKIHAAAAWAIIICARLVNWIVRPIPWSIRYGVVATLWACLLTLYSERGYNELIEFSGITGKHILLLEKTRLLDAYQAFVGAALWIALICAASAVTAFHRKYYSLILVRVSSALVFCYSLLCFYFIGRIPGTLFTFNDPSFPKTFRNELWISGFIYWFPLFLAAFAFLLMTWLNSSYRFYRRMEPGRNLPGDLLIENIRTHGGDPVFRTSFYWSIFIHVFFIFILPVLLLGGFRWMKPYGIPKGSGVQNPGAVVKMIKIKKPKKKPKQLFVLNPNSPILFYKPDIDESRIMDDVAEETENKYEATGAEKGAKGKLGKGGGTKGGWPDGVEGAKIRFIRLKYDGGDWDQCMGVGADYNFLIQFNKLTGFKIADKTEAIEFSDLKRFPSKRAPPFVYITGSGNINVGQKEIKALRWYCLEEGGLLFADNGGGHFDYSLRNLMRQAFPELQWIDISNDDIIYQQPYSFPNGAPPLWHHSGNRAMGLKYNGRWICFYHQGDMKDAWKDGHSGASKSVVDQAYKLGVNVVNYAFNQYMDLHFKQ